ncbi:hypothetical protein [Amycolatopsis sp. H20-H5]|uniref:hypothetical protein n=1 Tax=Amycolatopsis sp. H20-H5 TaxID=3046309 RepID=UPI002DB85157|nr:hypothetical protein [Amycolatopsis sp. H20-H5]MEC3974407.1 hypothetical protein [Amycolatopsis sp. H20-H5]
MGVIDRLRAFGFRRPHVLVLVGTGATRERLAAERWLRTQGWPVAATPADTDILLVCGADATIADAVYAGMPLPKVRIEFPRGAATTVGRALEDARKHLIDETQARAGRRDPPQVPTRQENHAGVPEPEAERGGHGGHLADRGGHEHGGHGGEEHSGHLHSGEVAGLAMADRAADRDGLKLDVLHVPLGPVLPGWPDGLVVDVVLQGDLVQEVTAVDVSGVPAAGMPFWSAPWLAARAGERVSVAEAERRRAASHLDSLHRLLLVLGAEGDSVQCAVLRDLLLTDAEIVDVTGRFLALSRRLRKSRTIRRMTDGLGPLSASAARRAGVGGPAQRGDGDVTARMSRWLLETGEALLAVRNGGEALLDADTSEGPRGPASAEAALLTVLPGLIAGTELAAARVIVASLDPDCAGAVVPGA